MNKEKDKQGAQDAQVDNDAERNGQNAETGNPEPNAEQPEAGEIEAATNEKVSPADETDKLKAEVAELKDKYIRLYSEFDNYRRRTSKEKIDLVKTATEDLIVNLLPVVDDFERAQKSFENTADVAAIKEGVSLIFNKFVRILDSKGLKAMDTIGQAFDPEIHEAITQIPAPQDDLKGKVVDEVEKGYYLHDKTVRFAKVVIGA